VYTDRRQARPPRTRPLRNHDDLVTGLTKDLTQVEDKSGNATHTHIRHGKGNLHVEGLLNS
jgi:hypothetical protein